MLCSANTEEIHSNSSLLFSYSLLQCEPVFDPYGTDGFIALRADVMQFYVQFFATINISIRFDRVFLRSTPRTKEQKHGLMLLMAAVRSDDVIFIRELLENIVYKDLKHVNSSYFVWV